MKRDKVILITGANSGLGYEIAKWSAMMGATVILACRSESKTKEAVVKMNQEFQDEKSKRTSQLSENTTLALEFMHLDLVSFESVTNFCEAFKKSGRKLHVLFCNAGLGFIPYQKTADGMEMLLQVNYLSHFVIIAKLLEVMQQSGPDCRILLMSSVAHQWGTFDLKTINYSGPPDRFSSKNYYGRSKLYQIMQAAAMGRRISGSNVTINSIHPGVVDTPFWRDWDSGIRKCLLCCIKCWVAISSFEGAKCSIDLTVNPKHAGVNGLYWVDFKIVTPSSDARNKQKQEELWETTLELVRPYLTEEEMKRINLRN
ncbi:WW domain-containing oxidoreductase-like [Dreissena polymorpha]|nr:WW domain-containing oxidoreductase-like [Dreissena polymorpha]